MRVMIPPYGRRCHIETTLAGETTASVAVSTELAFYQYNGYSLTEIATTGGGCGSQINPLAIF